MKANGTKAAYCTILLFLFSITTYSQDNWTWLNPKPMGYTFYGSAVIPSSSTLIAVGTKGVIAKTTDNGSSWILIRTDSTSILNSVHFPTSTVGYACGTNSTLLKTTNGGESWTSLTPPLPGIGFTQIQFTDSQTGFLLDKINYRLYKTTDGGSVWAVYVNENTYGNFNSFYMIDGNNGFIATDDGSVGKITAGVSNFSNITSSSLKVIRFTTLNRGCDGAKSCENDD
ncbi:MAG: hypothetical protein IPJ75_19585 [Ignavibacteriales bacterium]|nr:hypothetical protein [Ignavibacteriales bacterium]